MITGGPTKAHIQAAKEKLIQEGAASYVQATIAMNEFKRIVQDHCGELALERLGDINRIMGTNLTEDDLHHWPKKGKPLDPEWPLLCMYFTIKDVGDLHVGLYWTSLPSGDYQLHAFASLEFLKQELFQKALERFKKVGSPKLQSFPGWDLDLCFSELISVEEAGAFPEKLDSVLAGFLEGWGQIDGQKGLKESRSKAWWSKHAGSG